MKDYCQSKDECQKKQILEYFGFKAVKQNKCCVCDPDSSGTDAPSGQQQKVRKLPADNRNLLENEISAILNNVGVQGCCMPSLIDVQSPDINVVKKNMDELEYFESELEFLKNYGILDDDSASKIFTTICTYTNPE